MDSPIPIPCLLGCEEGLEQLRQPVNRYAGAGVGDGDFHRSIVARSGCSGWLLLTHGRSAPPTEAKIMKLHVFLDHGLAATAVSGVKRRELSSVASENMFETSVL